MKLHGSMTLALAAGAASVLAKSKGAPPGTPSIDAPFTFDAAFPSGRSPLIFAPTDQQGIDSLVVVWTDCVRHIRKYPIPWYLMYADASPQCLQTFDAGQFEISQPPCLCRTVWAYSSEAELESKGRQELRKFAKCQRVYTCKGTATFAPTSEPQVGSLWRCPDRFYPPGPNVLASHGQGEAGYQQFCDAAVAKFSTSGNRGGAGRAPKHGGVHPHLNGPNPPA